VRSEKSNDAVQALTFLVEHYLGTDAKAKGRDNPDFAAFTFDHRLDGVIAGERDDTDELFLIRVVDSVFRHETLVAGVAWWEGPDVLSERRRSGVTRPATALGAGREGLWTSRRGVGGHLYD
jgi:hypothetical protein